MTENDYSEFTAVLEQTYKIYDKEPDKDAYRMFFDLLSDYSIQSVRAALSAHMRRSNFPPTPAHLFALLDGKTDLKPVDVIAAARNAKTPFGVIARIKIGTWNLDNLKDYDLQSHAQAVIQLFPEIQGRAFSGEYSEHEIKTMLKHKVNPARVGFFGGDVTQEAKQKLVGVVKSKYQTLQLEHKEQQEKASAEFSPDEKRANLKKLQTIITGEISKGKKSELSQDEQLKRLEEMSKNGELND